MSRDFELLQRLEREWDKPPGIRGASGDAASRAIQNGAGADAELITARFGLRLPPGILDELKKLVIRAFLSDPGVRSVVFTRIEAQETEWIAASAANLLAESGRGRVCLLDADLGSPAMQRLYSVSTRVGLCSVIEGTCSVADAMVRAGENLWLIPAGATPSNLHIPANKFSEIVAAIHEHCEYLVVSAPDCDKHPEVSIMGAAVDGAVLVLDAEVTRRTAARRAKSALEMAKIRVLGSAVKSRLPSNPELLFHRA